MKDDELRKEIENILIKAEYRAEGTGVMKEADTAWIERITILNKALLSQSILTLINQEKLELVKSIFKHLTLDEDYCLGTYTMPDLYLTDIAKELDITREELEAEISGDKHAD